MASKNYIPTKDADFANWLANLASYVATNYTALGLTVAQSEALAADKGEFDTAYNAHLVEIQTAKSKRQAKSERRDAAEATVRTLVKLMQANPAVTDVQRQAMNITVPDPTKTPAPPPTTYPVPQVKDIESLEHTLLVTDSATADRAKPDGVRGTEVWMTILAPGQPLPVDPSDLTLVDVTSTGKVVQAFAGADANKTAVYRMRYVNTRNERGPWGPQVSATIAA